MSLLDGEAQCRAARPFGNSAMTLFMCRQVERLIRNRHRINPHRKFLQIAAVFDGGAGGEEDRGLNLERFADNKMPANILARRYADARSRGAPALEQTLELESQQCF